MVLKAHARHYATDEPIPDELLTRLRKARRFNEGFNTVEYTASALVGTVIPAFSLLAAFCLSIFIYFFIIFLGKDTALHKVSAKDLDVAKFEIEELERLGMPEGIIMRHRPAHFQRM